MSVIFHFNETNTIKLTNILNRFLYCQIKQTQLRTWTRNKLTKF